MSQITVPVVLFALRLLTLGSFSGLAEVAGASDSDSGLSASAASSPAAGAGGPAAALLHLA